MRQVKMVVGATPIGTAKTWAYPDGMHLGEYSIPTYELTVSGTDGRGLNVVKAFEVLRFGIHCEKGSGVPRVVGLASQQKHDIKAWLPNYTVHSASSVEMGAWQVYGNFLIHDGPDDPQTEVYASIGCIEICRGPQGFDKFNDLLIELSGASGSNRANNLAAIGNAKNMSIEYKAAVRPELKRP